jgi:thiamine pyrophosphate-dependent acetolactate synthase large subunit-like protein
MAADAPPHPLLELVDPSIGWVALARAYGVAAASCADAGELSDLLRDTPGAGGPFLIEAVMR